MSAVAVDIADAIVQALNIADFGDDTFNAVRRFAPLTKHEDYAALKVTVVPGKVLNDDSIGTRGQVGETIETSIGIQRLVAIVDNAGEPSDDGAVALLSLAESVRVYLIRRKLQNAPDARFVSIEQVQAFSPQEIREKHLMSVFLTVRHSQPREARAS